MARREDRNRDLLSSHRGHDRRNGRRARVPVVFEFPYGSPAMNAADWTHPRGTARILRAAAANRIDLERRLDDTTYSVAHHLARRRGGDETGVRASLRADSVHRPTWPSAAAFAPPGTSPASSGPSATFAAAETHWSAFWNSGAAIDLSAAPDPRAHELERRIVLSQYLTAIQCAGSMPPQETGLTCNSWYGKFHLEMHWWHAAHFALGVAAACWSAASDWYRAILPSAREKARQQGYAGARWPKMIAPDGRDSPSPIGPLLIWQQPHPIVMAELCYAAHPTRDTLERYRDIVFESAEFMASYAHCDAKGARYVLGPPVIPAQENHPPRETWNPTFELAYWDHALAIAAALA